MARNRFDVLKKSHLNFGLGLLTKTLVAPAQIGKAVYKDLSSTPKPQKDEANYQSKIDNGNYYLAQLQKVSELSSFVSNYVKEPISLKALSALSKLSSTASSYNSANAARRESLEDFIIKKLEMKSNTLKTEVARGEYILSLNLYRAYLSEDGKQKFNDILSSIA